MKRFFLLVMLILCTLTGSVYAEDANEESAATDVLFEETVQKVDDAVASTEGESFSQTAKEAIEHGWNKSITDVLDWLKSMFFLELSNNINALIKIVVLAVLAGVICNLNGPFNGEGVASVSFLVCFIVIAGFAANILSEIINTAIRTIDNLNIFMQSLIPAISGVVAVTGAASLVALSPSLFICMQVITYLAKNVFLPMIMLITSLSVINNMTGRFHITKLIEFARQALKWSSGILLTVYIGLLGLQSFSFSFASGVAGKTVKYAICNFIPLVGAVLSDSVEAVCASAVMVKNAMGIAGVLSLLSICASPLIKLLVISLLYRFAAGIAEPVTDKRIVNLLSELAGNITQTFVILLMVCVMFIISVAMMCMVANIPMIR